MSGTVVCFIKRVSVFLITAALLVAGAGCSAQPPPESSYIDINDWIDLNNIRNNLGGSYRLVNSLTSATLGYDVVAGKTANKNQGWIPIGTSFGAFTGWFEGNGNEIRDLFSDSPDQDYVGLFGYVGRIGVIANVKVVNVTVKGKSYAGGLAGRNDGTVTINCSSSGMVTGTSCVGGLIGWNNYGTVMSNSRSACSVVGNSSVGGLVGYNQGTVSNSYSTGSVNGNDYVGGLVGHNHLGSTVSICYSTGIVTGNDYVGGLVGHNREGTVSKSYSGASVTGNDYVGGLVGYAEYGTVGSSFSTGSVIGTSSVGGLVGHNTQGSVSNSCCTGSVSGNGYVGGLVGHNSAGAVSSSYSSGPVTGSSSAGGLVGSNDVGGTVSDSFWDKGTSGMETSSGGTGKTTAQMKDLDTFYNTATEGLGNPWNIRTVALGTTDSQYAWNIVDEQTYPFLSWRSID